MTIVGHNLHAEYKWLCFCKVLMKKDNGMKFSIYTFRQIARTTVNKTVSTI